MQWCTTAVVHLAEMWERRTAGSQPYVTETPVTTSQSVSEPRLLLENSPRELQPWSITQPTQHRAAQI